MVDAVDGGSKAVERVQHSTAKTAFSLLAQVTPLKVPVSGLQEIHDTAIHTVHGMIRLVNRVAGSTLDAVLDVVEQRASVAEAKADAAEPKPAEGAPKPGEDQAAS